MNWNLRLPLKISGSRAHNESETVKKPLHRMQLETTTRSAREVMRLFQEYGDLDPAYQRGSVWTEDQRQALIYSLIVGLPIPAVIANARHGAQWPKSAGRPIGGYEYACIDGKQRIETITQWFSGELAVPSVWFDESDLLETANDTVTFDGLVASLQRHMGLTWTIPFVEAKVGSIQEESRIFLLVNGAGTAQTEQSLLNAANIAEL